MGAPVTGPNPSAAAETVLQIGCRYGPARHCPGWPKRKNPAQGRAGPAQRAPLAEAVAAEWDAQVDVINPHAMPLTKLANTAIDRAIPEKSKIAAEILEFAGSDMVCYRAESPAGLVLRQTSPLGSHHCLGEGGPERRFCNGEHHHPQAPVPSSASGPGSPHHIARPIFICRGPQPHHAHRFGPAGGNGRCRQNPADAAWLAANVDEDWQIETWGEDAEAMARRAGRFNEFSACVRFVNLAHNRP